MRSVLPSLFAAASVMWAAPAFAQEDGGTSMKRPGYATERANKEAADFTSEQVKAAVDDHIQARLKEGGGVFRLIDDRSGDKLELEFVRVGIVGVGGLWRIHDPARKAEGGGYFACTFFRPAGAPREKLYDIDLWLSPRDGRLEVTEVRIHKEPRLVKGKWVREPRYTVTK